MSVFNPRLTGKVNLTGTRYGTGTRLPNGRYVEGGTTALSFTANHQPLTGSEMLELPEGERVRNVRKLYTATTLRPADVSTKARADEVDIDGETYVVFRTMPYNMGVLDHHKVIVIRRDQ